MVMVKRYIVILLMLLVPISISAKQVIYDYADTVHPITAGSGMVVAQEALAADVGRDILAAGGNAVDAAVAVGFALAVTLPRAGNLGGGGFMLVHLADRGETVAIDYREKAPFEASSTMFLNADGTPNSELSRYSILSSGVPGTVAGLCHALETYGTMSLKQVLEPAIRLARKGFPVSKDLKQSLSYYKDDFKKDGTAYDVFFDDKQGGNVPDVLKQRELAWSLTQIAKKGPAAFYEGPIAKRIVAFMEDEGGLISRKDLRSYQPESRVPVSGTYRGYDVYSMPPPSSGGVHLIQMLNSLEPFPLYLWKSGSAQSIHAMSEVMKIAYADRSRYLGDPDFVDVPVEWLTSSAYARAIHAGINMNAARASRNILPGDPRPFYESNETTHFSVVDKDGNAVSNTYTLNFSYGNRRMVPGTGILLNNQMDDFAAKPGAINAYGLVGSHFNAIAPGKRMLSSMTPTIVLKNGSVFMVTGSPGGSRIITTVLQMIVNVIDFDMSIAEATYAPRFHHQWVPDELRVEKGFSPDTLKLLEGLGHSIATGYAMGSTQSIVRKKGVLYGSADPRKPGAKVSGYD